MKSMKVILTAVTLIFLSSCGNREYTPTFTAKDSVYVPLSVAQRITVYGDIHAVITDRLDVSGGVQQTQMWLCRIVTEPIVIAESIPYSDSPLTVGYMIAESKKHSPGVGDEQVIDGLNTMSNENISYLATFVLHTNKLILGGEDDSLYQAIGKLGPGRNSQVNIDLRSKAILLNTIKVAEKYPDKRIAIVIGRKHLAWFAYNGIKIVDPRNADIF